MEWTVERRTTTQPLDLAVLAGLLPIAVLAIHLGWPLALRAPLGFLLGYFLPGYALVALVFPESAPELRFRRRTGRAAPPMPARGLHVLERVALSLALSIVLTPALAYLLDFVPAGITKVSLLYLEAGVTLLFAVLAYVVRRETDEERRPRFTLPAGPWLRDLPGSDVAMQAIVIVSATVLVGVLLSGGPASGSAGAPFTAFYLLPGDGSGTCYPEAYRNGTYQAEACPGAVANVTVRITNYERRDQEYTVYLEWRQNGTEAGDPGASERIAPAERWTVALAHLPIPGDGALPLEVQYGRSLALAPPPFEGLQRLVFQLHRASDGEFDRGEPHHALVLHVLREDPVVTPP